MPNLTENQLYAWFWLLLFLTICFIAMMVAVIEYAPHPPKEIIELKSKLAACQYITGDQGRLECFKTAMQ
jgi:hypothetical protein